MLYKLERYHPDYYRRIVDVIGSIVPFFDDFSLKPIENSIILQWREKGSDVVFGVHQASDGMLRAIALVTLLLQPKEDLPSVIIIDEPELGLHPQAIEIICGLLKSVSLHTQVIVATQSPVFIDYFEPEDIVVIERKGRESIFKRLDSEELADWRKEYSLSELWDKNVIGGRP